MSDNVIKETLGTQRQSRGTGRLLPTLIFVISLASTVYCMSNQDVVPSVYKNLWILPFAQTIIFVLFYFIIFKGDITRDIPSLIITLAYSLRNSFTPAIMTRDGVFYSKMGIASNEKIANIGIAVFIWETIVVFLLIGYYAYYGVRYKRIKRINANNQIFKLILFTGLVMSAALFFILPELRTEYYTIFNSDITHIVTEEVVYSGGIKRALSTASNLIIEGARTVACSYFIFYMRKKWNNTGSYLLSFIIVGLQFLFMNDSNAYIIMLALSLCILILKLYPERKKKTIIAMVILSVVFAVLIAVNRFLQSSWAQSLSLFLQGYFPGLSNFTSIERLTDMNVWQRLRQIIYDLYACVPFRSTLFGYKGGMENTNALWVAATGRRNQIMPNMALGYFYFGGVLAPVLSALMIRRSYKYYDKLQQEYNPIRYTLYSYLFIYACLAPVMYNNLIYLKMFLNRYLFMWIFSCFSNYSFDELEIQR